MKTKEQILEAVKNGMKPRTIDGRDFERLSDFFPVEDWETFGYKLIEGETHTPEELTEENVKTHLASDLQFSFEKCYDQRGLSSATMYQVIKMWLWVLDDPLQDFDDYGSYGRPLYQAVAEKYGFNDPIAEWG